MLVATAGMTASIRIVMPDYTYAPTATADVLERYMQLLAPPVRNLSDFKPGGVISLPSPIRPHWFADTLRRVRASVRPTYSRENCGGPWLDQAVGDAAAVFFQNTSDLLPGEPFIYGSQLGDLVAEFKAEHGTMTTIVSPKFALLFAVIDGVPIERKVPEGDDIREQVQLLTAMLRMGRHGAMDTTK